MAEIVPPLFEGANCYTFSDFRHAFGGVVCEEGVTYSGSLAVTAAGGASVNVNVAAGSAWILGDLNGASGQYFVENDASKVVTIAANGAGTSRIDRIIATVYDSQFIGTADTWAIEVVQGVAGGGVPAVPNSTRSGWLELGQVTVPASGGTPSVVNNTDQLMGTCGHQNESSPYVLIASSAATSVPHNTVTTLALPTTIHLDDNYFSVASSVVTILQDGVYNITVNANFASSTQNALLQFVAKPGAGANIIDAKVADSTEHGGAWTTTQYPLSAGATVKLNAYQFQFTGSAAVDATGHLVITKAG